MTIDDITAARRSIAALSPLKKQRRYPLELRATLARLVRLHPELRIADLAQRLDLPPQRLRRFAATAPPVEMVPVRIVADVPAREQVVVRGPGGLVVEGLDVQGVADLFRALS